MGVFKTKFLISSIEKREFVELEGYVDTEATYSVVPSHILEKLGIKRARKIRIKGICCEKIVNIGDALFRIRVDGEFVEGVASVIFGDDPSLVLIGSHTLEALGLKVDPLNKKIKRAIYVVMY